MQHSDFQSNASLKFLQINACKTQVSALKFKFKLLLNDPVTDE